jgi:hypothetical protein
MPHGRHRTYGSPALHHLVPAMFLRSAIAFLRSPRGRNRFLSILEQTARELSLAEAAQAFRFPPLANCAKSGGARSVLLFPA